MALRDRQWRRFLNAPDPELLSELYEPALSQAVRYDRCCAYFSSTVLAVAARGFAPLVERLLAAEKKGDVAPVRLLVNEELTRDDVDAMLHAHGADALADKLAARLLEPRDALERERLALLGLLVKRGLLEVRVGVMRSGRGILHAKFGVITDAAGDSLVFSGSGNESAYGLIANYEELEITTSWSDAERLEYFRTRFEELWSGHNSQVEVIPLPAAVRDRLIRYAKHDDIPVSPPRPEMCRRDRLEAWMRWQFALEAPWFPDGGRNCDAMAPGVWLWPHQVRVVEECAGAWPAGRLLCDEVGMGKTVEAIMILRRLLAGRGVRRALLLLPAGILKQWQGELREKGGLLVPRLEGQSTLVWPDERVEQTLDFATALRQPLLLVSREMARLEQNAAVILQAPKWDLVLLDEAHAARRANQVETEFNSATLLLDLLRQLQLQGRARGLLLLSATPMQTHPWEPWDLLGVLGEGSPWLAEFRVVREFYEGIAAAGDRPVPMERGRSIAHTVSRDSQFPGLGVEPSQLPTRLFVAPSSERRALATGLRKGAPLGRRMHRNTRQTLRSYFAKGLLDKPPAQRVIQDVRYEFADPAERDLYDGIQTYVERRFQELERERPGKGFVMTVYRRRAASSPLALKRSLERRRHGLEMVVRSAAADEIDDLESSDRQDIDELLGEGRGPRIPSSLSDDPAVARQELRDVDRLLAQLNGLSRGDSKLTAFMRALRTATDDGRPCLVFSEFTDTVEYLRDALFPTYGAGVACYTGDGGSVYEDGTWRRVSKEAITERLANREVRVLVCSDAASEGLNLQVASALVNYDLPWNPARVEQRIGRVDRIGQNASDIRVVNLVLADSVDERVYQVLGQRCNLFESYVGAMQPVLSVARQMLLGVQPFSAAALNREADRAQADALANAAFEGTEEPPPSASPPGVVIEDLARAFGMLKRDLVLDTLAGSRRLAPAARELAENPSAVPLSPFLPEVRRAGQDLMDAGDRPPLVLGAAEQGSFRVVVAVWANEDGQEIVDRAERLEALMGMWNGQQPTEQGWREAHAVAERCAAARLKEMVARANDEERAALQRQVDAARDRLLRELARFLACAVIDNEDFNAAFHRSMQRGGQVGALLVRAHGLVGYPEWPSDLVEESIGAVEHLSANQRTNVLLGTPLEAAVRDPRWQAANASSVSGA
ncbi:MAG TPA: helicase-related protein [Gemmatimonadaceae bacterium]|nr:helicase-related protein [Gemmatimonadaceae bacterium]